MSSLRTRITLLAALLAFAGCGRASDADPRMVSEWTRTLYGAIRVERLSPPVASRLLVYANAALYAGLATTAPELLPLGEAVNGLPPLPRAVDAEPVDGTLVAVAAQRVVLDSLLREAMPTTRAAWTRLADSLDAGRVADGVAADVRARSLALGDRIGLAIVAWSRTDGFDGTRGRAYVAPTGEGLWVNDAPATIYAQQNLSGATDFVQLDNPANVMRGGGASDRALILNRPKARDVTTLPAVNMAGAAEPYWSELRPFALATWDACPVPDAPPYSTAPGSAFREEAMQVVTTRAWLTPEQRTIALYWADNAGESGTPPGHWIAIASQVSRQRGLTAADAARITLMTAIAQADAFIASWGYKYRRNLIRPRTYIRAVIDSTWEPLIPTPPFPEYPSGHSTQSAAAAEVLTALLGAMPFEDSTSISIGHAARRFDSFRAAADEAGLSRIYGGIHFPVGNTAGQALGRCIGAAVVQRFGVAAR